MDNRGNMVILNRRERAGKKVGTQFKIIPIWLLTPKFDRGTWHFLEVDMRHRAY